MKNLKILMAAAFLILALSACQKAEIANPEVKVPPVATGPATTLAQLCAGGNGNWLAEFEECENVAKDWCEAKGGKFDECGSACRHDPKAELCTMQCVPFCSFKATPPLVGGDKDAHGCIGSAGYMWCENKTKCLRIWEEACWPEVAEAIQQAFVVKYKKPIEQIQVTVNQLEGDYAKGGVKFAMKGQFGEGGIFFAAKVDGKWSIVFDGNGLTTCDIFKPYDFPASMVEGVCLK